LFAGYPALVILYFSFSIPGTGYGTHVSGFFLPSAATDDPLPPFHFLFFSNASSCSLPAAPTPLRPIGGGSEGEQQAAAVLLRKEQGSWGKSKAR